MKLACLAHPQMPILRCVTRNTMTKRPDTNVRDINFGQGALPMVTRRCLSCQDDCNLAVGTTQVNVELVNSSR